MHTPPVLAALLAQQGGVLSREQALAAGLTPDAWLHRIDSGRWQRWGDGVAIGHSGPPTPRQLAMVAVLHCGPGAALTADAALVGHGAKRVHVLRHDVAVPADRRVGERHLPGLVIVPHRVSHLRRWRTTRHGLPVLHAPAATLHAAAWAPDGERAEDRVVLSVQQGLTTVAQLRVVLRDLPRLPRRGLVRAVLDDAEHGATAATELAFLRFCRRHRLPEPDEMQLRVRACGTTRYVDARYRRPRVLLELDGAHHRWAAQWEADAMRTLQLAVAHQDRLVRITGAMLRHHEVEVAQLLRELLRPCAAP